MNISLLTWMCDKAEGFRMDDKFCSGRSMDSVVYEVSGHKHTVLVNDIERELTWPLLLMLTVKRIISDNQWYLAYKLNGNVFIMKGGEEKVFEGTELEFVKYAYKTGKVK